MVAYILAHPWLFWFVLTVAVDAAVVLVVILALVIWWHIDEAILRYRLRQFDAGRAYERSRMHDMSWWFSEDLPTMAMLRGIADGRELFDVRNEWRMARAAAGRVEGTTA